MNNVAYIALTQGKYAIVDVEYFDFLNQWKWHFNKSGARRAFYPNGRKVPPIKLWMHRVLMEYLGYDLKEMQVDHINGNPLDNRRANLRVVTNAQNSMNRHTTNNKTGYKGVCWSNSHQKWKAKIKVDGTIQHIGWFKTPEEAAKAYNIAAMHYFGEYAALNNVPGGSERSVLVDAHLQHRC